MCLFKMTEFGLSEKYQYLEMQFDSLDAQSAMVASYSSTNWPHYYLAKPLSNIAALKVLEVQIPFSYYVIDSTNNTFLLNVTGVCANGLITVPVGNYTSASLVSILPGLLNAAMIAQTPLTTLSWTATFSGAASAPTTNKFTFVLNAALSTATSFTFPTTLNFLTSALGMTTGGNAATFVTGTGMVLVSTNSAQITGPNYLYVNSRRMGALFNFYLPAGAQNNSNGGATTEQVAKIPINVQPGGIIYWQDPDPSKWFDVENLVNFNDVDFYLSLGNNSSRFPLNLNGSAFSIKLGILINKLHNNEVLGGGSKNMRVFSRIMPR